MPKHPHATKQFYKTTNIKKITAIRSYLLNVMIFLFTQEYVKKITLMKYIFV